MRNLSSKSLILAPFNTTKSNLNEPVAEEVKNLMLDRYVIKYGIRVREINKNYELNNNCDLDNGVFNKFA
jgi:hypothetical protein